MTTVERKGKINIQISIDPFLLFILTSIFIHGVGLLLFVLSNRSLPTARRETESTPIDFVVVPPEESSKEPPPDTERIAANNSVAEGKVNPELPSATDKIGNEGSIAKSEPSQAVQPNIQEESPVVDRPPTSSTPKVDPNPRSEPQPAITPPLLSKLAKPEKTPSASVPPREELKPNTPIPSIPKPIKKSQPSVDQSSPVTSPPLPPIEPKPETTPSTSPPEEIQPAPPVVQKPEPIAKTPLLSELDSTPIPLPKPSSPPESKPSREIETATPQPDLPSKSELVEPSTQSDKKPLTEIEKATPQPNIPPIATNLPPKIEPIEPSTQSNQSPSVPETITTPPPEQETPVGSGSASLLGGTYRKTLSEDSSSSSFFNPQANASQQALNPSGLDARQDLDLGPYFAEIRRRVKRNWRPSSPGDNRHTVLAFSIQRNGQITGLQIIQSSGSSKVDRESLEAVQKSGPFDALPANFPNAQLNVEFNFNIYVNQGVFAPQLENWQRF